MDPNPPVLRGPVYDALKTIALVVLPGLGAFYFTIAAIWGLPYAEQVLGTITAVDTLLGIVLKRSSTNYERAEYDVVGDVVYEQYPNGEVAGMHMEARHDPFVLPDNAYVRFKVGRETIREEPLDP